MKRISKTEALNLIKKSAGKFITIKFTKKDGSERLMNCKFHNNTELGLVRVTEICKLKKGESGIRNFYIKDLISFKANKIEYTVA